MRKAFLTLMLLSGMAATVYAVNPYDAVRVIEYNLSPSVNAFPVDDFTLGDDGSVKRWNASKLGTPPTIQQILAITQQQVDDYHHAVAKTAASSQIDGNDGYDWRAIALMAIQEINTLRQAINTLAAAQNTAVANATNLANLQSRWASGPASLPTLPDRTLAQGKAAYKNLLSGSSLDE